MGDPGGAAARPREVTYRIRLTPRLVWAVVAPYVSERLRDQLKALAPITAFLFAFQLVVLRQGVSEGARITLGLACVVLGLMFFIEGLRLGVMLLGENIGASLPARARLPAILGAAFLLGAVATFAEPAVATLTVLGASVTRDRAPLLYEYLNHRTGLLLLVVAVGVGAGAVNGMLRLIRNRSLKRTILPGLAVTVLLTLVAAFDPLARDMIGVGWDAGGITTGTVTAPLVLALGVGMSRALGKSETGMSGFGIITLCSIWPIACVLAVALIASWTGGASTPDASAAATGSAVPPPAASVPALIGENLLGACASVLPLIALLVAIQRLVLRERIRNVDHVVVGVGFALLGLFLFKIGLLTGLAPLGDQAGANATLAFSPDGGLYGGALGRVLVLAFAFLVGYGASLAEPALVTLGLTVEEVTAGAFKRWLVMHSVGVGVGIGLIVGVARIMFGWSSLAIVLPSYALVLLLTAVSDDTFVSIGWDSGGVTTGDITSPVLIALGLGVAAAVGGADGFSLIAMGSVWPIITVLTLGLVVRKTTPSVRGGGA